MIKTWGVGKRWIDISDYKKFCWTKIFQLLNEVTKSEKIIKSMSFLPSQRPKDAGFKEKLKTS